MVSVKTREAEQSAEPVFILLAHGSRQAEANRSFETLAERVASASGLEGRVLHAFWEMARPDLSDAAREAVTARGARWVVVLPYFLSDGVHIRRDIPEALSRFREAYPGVVFDLLPSLQNDPLLEALLIRRLREAAESDPPGLSGTAARPGALGS